MSGHLAGWPKESMNGPEQLFSKPRVSSQLVVIVYGETIGRWTEIGVPRGKRFSITCAVLLMRVNCSQAGKSKIGRTKNYALCTIIFTSASLPTATTQAGVAPT